MDINVFTENSGEADHFKEKLREMARPQVIRERVLEHLGKVDDPERVAVLRRQALFFIQQAANNRLVDDLQKYNANAFDEDREMGLDYFEFGRFKEALEDAIDNIILLDSYGQHGVARLRDVHEAGAIPESLGEIDGAYEAARYAADWVNIEQYIPDNFARDTVSTVTSMNPAAVEQVKESYFDPRSEDSWQNLGIVLAYEFPEQFEETMRVTLNSLSANIVLPEYLLLRARIIQAESLAEMTEAEIQKDNLVEDNPGLKMLELFGEKGVDMLRNIGGKLKEAANGRVTVEDMAFVIGMFSRGLLSLTLTGAKMVGKGAGKYALKNLDDWTLARGKLKRRE